MKKSARKKSALTATRRKIPGSSNDNVALAPTGRFDEVLALIEAARGRAYQAVSTERRR